jgi:hypothetical protein
MPYQLARLEHLHFATVAPFATYATLPAALRSALEWGKDQPGYYEILLDAVPLAIIDATSPVPQLCIGSTRWTIANLENLNAK